MRTSLPMSLATSTMLLALLLAGPALAADDKAPTAQQSKMTTCQKEAGDKKLEGKERQAFVTECLKAKPAAAEAPASAASQTQGQKLGACSKEAASQGLKGEERKKFLSTCAKA